MTEPEKDVLLAAPPSGGVALPIEEPIRSGVDLIAEERQRQISIEGWTPEHDDAHVAGELLAAAICYTHAERASTMGSPSWDWPWSDDWWKPSAEPIRNLVKAGALIAAEIDRLQRKGPAREPDGTRASEVSDSPHSGASHP